MGNSKIARENLAKEIKNGAVIIHSGDIVYRNNDTWYPFRQDSNFYYLTEWPEPEAHAVILIKDSKYELHMFVQDRNCLLYTSPSPRDATLSRMPSSA